MSAALRAIRSRRRGGPLFHAFFLAARAPWRRHIAALMTVVSRLEAHVLFALDMKCLREVRTHPPPPPAQLVAVIDGCAIAT